MLASGALSEATLAWHEGAPEWAPLGRVLGEAAPARPSGASLARGALRSAPAASAAADDEDADAQLRSWQAEVSRLEAGAPPDEDRPATPECAHASRTPLRF
jgi:hypothetical protein